MFVFLREAHKACSARILARDPAFVLPFLPVPSRRFRKKYAQALGAAVYQELCFPDLQVIVLGNWLRSLPCAVALFLAGVRGAL